MHVGIDKCLLWGLSPKVHPHWVLIPAAISTLPAVISGQSSKKNLENICLEAQNTLKNHELFANITTWSILLLSLIWIYITLKGYTNLKIQKLLCAFLSLVFISAMITCYKHKSYQDVSSIKQLQKIDCVEQILLLI